MNNKLKCVLVAGLLLKSSATYAQTTIQSPYSKFGLGNLNRSILPQQRSMGGIGTGIFRSSYINNINMQNPASYAGIGLTTLDIGMSARSTTLKTSTLSENSINGSLSHVAMAFPVTTKSAFSIGILPYSELGYDFKNTVNVGTNADNTKPVDYVYNGEGGLSKAYLGYGIQFGDHFRVGANVEYLFGNLIQSASTEYTDASAINSRTQVKNSIYGFNYSYGIQYDFRLGNKTSLVIGYSGSSASKLNSELSQYSTIYQKDSQGNESSAIDTLDKIENGETNLKLPLIHNIGFSLQKGNKWLIGADYRIGKWSELSINNTNQNLQNTHGVSVGAQFTPDVTAISGYFKRVDYRVGFAYDKTYIQMNNQDVKQTAVTFGLGLPLSSFSRSSFYKMNVSAEIGKRGNVSNGLIQENYATIHLGFMLNDKWFQRFRFD